MISYLKALTRCVRPRLRDRGTSGATTATRPPICVHTIVVTQSSSASEARTSSRSRGRTHLVSLALLLSALMPFRLSAQTIVPHRDFQVIDSLNRGKPVGTAPVTVNKEGYVPISKEDGRSYYQHLGRYITDSLDIRGIDTLYDYTALRAYTDSSTIVYLQKAGITGFFVEVQSGTDDGGVVIVGDDARIWYRVHDPVEGYSIQWWQATPDDGIDDRDSVQQALDFVDSIGGGLVLVPPGVYTLTDNAYREALYLGDNTTLRGQGSGSEFRYTGHATLSSTAIQNRRSSGQYSDYQQRTGNENIHIEGIKLSFAERDDFKNIGINLSGVLWGSIKDTWVDSCGGYSYLIGRTNDTDTIGNFSKNIILENLKVTNMNDVGLEIWGAENVVARNIDISGRGNDVGYGNGIYVWNGAKNVHIYNAKIEKDTNDYDAVNRYMVGVAVGSLPYGDTITGAIKTQNITFENCQVRADMGFRINPINDTVAIHRVDSVFILDSQFLGYDTVRNASDIRHCRTLVISGCTFDRFARHLQFSTTSNTTKQNSVSDVTIRDCLFTWGEGIDFHGITDFNIYDNRFYYIFDQAPITVRGGRYGLIKHNYFLDIGLTTDLWCITLDKGTGSNTRETRLIEITHNSACDDRSSLHTDDLVTMYNATDSITVKWNVLNCADTDADQYSNLGTGTQIWNETSGSSDHDWYEVGGTSPPNAISDNIFKSSGSVHIGGSSAAAQTFQVTGTARITGSSGAAVGLVGRDADGDINYVGLGDGLTFEDGALIVTGTGADSTFVMGDSICVVDIMGDTLCVSQDSTIYTDSTICIIILGDTTCYSFDNTGLNIYNGNGALTSNRTVELNNKSLKFDWGNPYGELRFNQPGITSLISVDGQFVSPDDFPLMTYSSSGGGDMYINWNSITAAEDYAIGIDKSADAFTIAEGTDLGGVAGRPMMQFYSAGDSIVMANDLLAGGSILRLRSNNTTAASGSQKGIEVLLKGTNATTSQATYGGYFSNTHGGTGAINVGVLGNASGGISNWGVNGIATGTGGYGVLGTGDSGYGIRGQVTTGYGAYGEATSGTALRGDVTTGIPLAITGNNTTTNSVHNLFTINRNTSGTAAAGIGSSITMNIEADNGTLYPATIIQSSLTTATSASRTSQYLISGLNSGSSTDLFTLAGSGQLTLNQYTTSNFNGGAAADSVLVITSAGVVKKRNAAAFGGGGGGGSVAWGSITGTLSAQTDLQTALDAKVNDTGNETIAGIKTFSSDPIVPAEAYASGWNGSNEPPTKNDVYDKIELFAAGTGIDHGGLTGLADDDHTIYAKLTGRSGGQTLIGGTATTDDLILQSTSGVGATGAEMQFKVGNNGATRAMTILNNGYVGIGTTATSPAYPLEIIADGPSPAYVIMNIKPVSGAVNNGSAVGLESRFLSTTKNWFFGAGSGGSPNNNSFRIVEVGTPNIDWFTIAPVTGYVGINTTAADKALEVNLGTASAFRLTYNDNSGSAAVYRDESIGSTGIVTFDAVGSGSSFKFEDPILLKGYTVATLPTGVTGMTAYVTDATAPTYLGTLTGGGAVVCPVFYNGSAWVSH